MHSQLTHVHEELELERLRATVATRRLEEREQRETAAALGHSGAGPRRKGNDGATLMAAAVAAAEEGASEGASEAAAAGMECDEPEPEPEPPSGSVAAMMATVGREERRARDAEAEAAASRTEASQAAEAMREAMQQAQGLRESTREEVRVLRESLERSQLEAAVATGGEGSRATLRLLERQLEQQASRGTRLAEQRRDAVAAPAVAVRSK